MRESVATEIMDNDSAPPHHSGGVKKKKNYRKAVQRGDLRTPIMVTKRNGVVGMCVFPLFIQNECPQIGFLGFVADLGNLIPFHRVIYRAK